MEGERERDRRKKEQEKERGKKTEERRGRNGVIEREGEGTRKREREREKDPERTDKRSERERGGEKRGGRGNQLVGASEQRVGDRKTDGRGFPSACVSSPVGRALPSQVDVFATVLPLKKFAIVTPHESERDKERERERGAFLPTHVVPS